MKLHILSDLHRDLAGHVSIPAVDADVVVLAGDIDEGVESLRWAMRRFTRPTLFVLGNHEIGAGDEQTLAAYRDLTEDSSVTILENDVWEYQDVRFLGCTLWAPASQAMRAAMAQSIAWLREMFAEPFAGKTVVITHHSPLHQSLAPEMLIDDAAARRLSVDLRDLIEGADIALWVHGHIHAKRDYFCGRTRVVCNPRGYSTMVEPGFKPDYLIEI